MYAVRIRSSLVDHECGRELGKKTKVKSVGFAKLRVQHLRPAARFKSHKVTDAVTDTVTVTRTSLACLRSYTGVLQPLLRARTGKAAYEKHCRSSGSQCFTVAQLFLGAIGRFHIVIGTLRSSVRSRSQGAPLRSHDALHSSRIPQPKAIDWRSRQVPSAQFSTQNLYILAFISIRKEFGSVSSSSEEPFKIQRLGGKEVWTDSFFEWRPN